VCADTCECRKYSRAVVVVIFMSLFTKLFGWVLASKKKKCNSAASSINGKSELPLCSLDKFRFAERPLFRSLNSYIFPTKQVNIPSVHNWILFDQTKKWAVSHNQLPL